MKRISILGCTGSIGKNTLDVISHLPQEFEVIALAAGVNMNLLVEQIKQFRPKMVSVANAELASQLKEIFGSEIEIGYGDEGILRAATHEDVDFVVTAIVGSIGLSPTLAAIESGKQIGIANKETLVTAGHLVTKAARKQQVELLPIDSEHSAIYQCLNGENPDKIHKLIVTSSGGALRDWSREQLEEVTVEKALNHPNWSMGAKVTIDSATMMNKGLEVIEAHWLFSIPYDRIEVLIHPESIVHSMVEFQDHSIMAQLGTPDMRVPIQYALTYPNRLPSPSRSLDLASVAALHFRKMDFERFPLLKLAYDCGRLGDSYPAVMNAANEVAVQQFLTGQISFLSIEKIIYSVVEKHEGVSNPSLEEIIHMDQWARKAASQIC